MSDPIKGFKAFLPDLTSDHGDMQYTVGEEFKMEGTIEICDRGFHFCKKAVDVFKYYGFDPKNRVCEVTALGRRELGRRELGILELGKQELWEARMPREGIVTRHYSMVKFITPSEGRKIIEHQIRIATEKLFERYEEGFQ